MSAELFLCGGPFDLPEPTSPNSPNSFTCKPASVVRGDTVACTLKLPAHHVPYTTSHPDSVFKAVAILSDEEGSFESSPADSSYVIDLTFGDGSASTTANVWSWQIAGPAVTNSEVSLRMYSLDTIGVVHVVTERVGFMVEDSVVSPSVSVSGAVSQTNSWGNTLLRADGQGLDKDGRRVVNWGRTLSPMLDDGLVGDSSWTARGIEWVVPYDTTHFTFVLVGSGPNEGLRYLTTPIQLGPVISIFSAAIDGQGSWADRQLGQGPDSFPDPPYCNKLTDPGIFSSLGLYVRQHEGSVSGAASHFQIFQDVVNGTTFQGFVQKTQRRWYRSWGVHPVVFIREALTQRIKSLGTADHNALDAQLSADASSIAGCTWVP